MRNLWILGSFLVPLLATAQFPSSYDLRNLGLVTPVKNQGNCGACWTFASCAAMESQYLKAGGTVVDLSEDNIADCHGFDEAPCAGGSFYMTNAMLSYHKGIYTEAQDPYTETTQDCPNSGPFPPSPWKFVEDIRFIPGTTNDIKSALQNYGAMASTMFFTMANYNAVNYTYYDAVIDAGDLPNAHGVTIIGWDDNMVVSGAPGNGAWIIKDSYGTSWANNGYFYCSYYDAGILTENAVFPIQYDLPNALNTPHLYAHDEFGWVDNHGYGAPVGYAMAKYTLIPSGGNPAAQQIRRVGTYAVEENMTITFELYHSKSGNTLSDHITTAIITTSEPGFYTVPLQLNSDALMSDVYIKVMYQGGVGVLNPIPIEKYELNHTSAFSASTNSAWISSGGSNWTAIGGGTSYNFDPCIKLYTEDAALAEFTGPTTVCQNETYQFQDNTLLPKDSVQWLIDGIYQTNTTNFSYSHGQAGSYEISLVAWLGDLSDTSSQSVTVNSAPATPTITQNVNQLTSSSANSYQWLDAQMATIPGETNQTFNPISSGVYYVEITDGNGCTAVSNAFNFTYVGLNELDLKNNVELIKITDLMGRETEFQLNTVLIYVYSDGTTKKVFRWGK